MEFSCHAVAYLDILGFSKFVEEAEDSNKPEKFNDLKKLFNKVIPSEISIDGRNSIYPEDLKLHCLTISDCFILSAPLQEKSSYPALIAVSIKAIQIAHSLLNMGFLVRGGIAVGNVYRTDSNILGTGYQEAVESEKNASNPQIILAKSAVLELHSLIERSMPRYAIFAKNELGQIILNSIFPKENYLPEEGYSVADYYRKYREIILENLNKLNGQESSKAKEKWIWFARLFNGNIRYFSSSFGSDVAPLLIAEAILHVSINYLNPPETSSNWMAPYRAPGMKIQFNRTSGE